MLVPALTIMPQPYSYQMLFTNADKNIFGLDLL